MAKEAWMVRMEAERAAWAKTPAGKATVAMYAAAEKAGMAEALKSVATEVTVAFFGGKIFAGVETGYGEMMEVAPERAEMGCPVPPFPEAAVSRAEAWLKKYGAKMGWEVR